MKLTTPWILLCACCFLSTMAVGQTGSPYFSLGAYVLDTRGTSNGLSQVGEEIIGLMSLGGGYEFQLDDSWSLGLDADLSLGGFDAAHYEQIDHVANMRINLTGIAFNLRPKYAAFVTSTGNFFVEGIGKLESFGSKAHFSFYDDRKDFSTAGTSSGFHFYYGGAIGYQSDLEDGNGTLISLGLISHDFGKAVNKLDLEQSGYFNNEHLKKRTSLVLRVIFYFKFNDKRRRGDSNGFYSIFPREVEVNK